MLEVKNLSVGYEGRAVIESLNFSAEKGDYLCIVGENGAGKSTLVKTLLGLQKPLGGEIRFSGKGIGYLPQQTVIQKDFPASVWEIVLSGNLSRLGRKAFYSRAERERANENLERLGISEIKNACFRELSGGQKQRVLLARALCASEEILFLDEPVSGLDPKVTLEFYKLTKKLNDEGITIIMVSHDLAAVEEYSNNVLHIAEAGYFFGSSEEYVKSEYALHFGIGARGEEE